MANPGRDLANPEIDDVLSEPRQREMQEVVESLASFEPTVIAVEWPSDRQAALDRAFSLSAERCLQDRSELVQLGFRLALRVGLEGLAAIDVIDEFWVPRIGELAASNAEAANHLAALTTAVGRVTTETEAAFAQRSLGRLLRDENTTAARQAALQPYLVHLVPIADAGDYPGPEAVANWYRRNFKIAANLISAVGPGDRVVVIYGSGHIPVLEHVLGANPGFLCVDPLRFLPA